MTAATIENLAVWKSNSSCILLENYALWKFYPVKFFLLKVEDTHHSCSSFEKRNELFALDSDCAPNVTDKRVCYSDF